MVQQIRGSRETTEIHFRRGRSLRGVVASSDWLPPKRSVGVRKEKSTINKLQHVKPMGELVRARIYAIPSGLSVRKWVMVKPLNHVFGTLIWGKHRVEHMLDSLSSYDQRQSFQKPHPVDLKGW
jgi:hypothetical protein